MLVWRPARQERQVPSARALPGQMGQKRLHKGLHDHAASPACFARPFSCCIAVQRQPQAMTMQTSATFVVRSGSSRSQSTSVLVVA
jgi:hypothetical protein